MSTITVHTGGLHDAAAQLRTLAGQLHESQMRTRNIVGGMGQDISGMRITSLITQNVMNIQKEYDKIHENYLQYAQFLNTAATTYELADDNLKKVIAAFIGAVTTGAVGSNMGSKPLSPTPTPPPTPAQPSTGKENGTGSNNLAPDKLTFNADSFASRDKIEYDSLTLNGVTVPAYLDKRLYDNYYRHGKIFYGDYGRNSTRYNNCAEYANRFYKDVFGVDIAFPIWGEAPVVLAGGGRITSPTTPQIGDIVFTDNHWAVVKAVNTNGTVTLIEQNWLTTGSSVAINTNRSISTDSVKFFRHEK